MKVYIFGGEGFVGGYLKKALIEKGLDVTVLDIKERDTKDKSLDTFFWCDIRDSKTFPRLKLEKDSVVINLAANQYHKKVPKKGRDDYFYSVNRDGVRNILQWTKESGGSKFIQYSTDMVYGRPKYLPVDTKHPLEPFGYYGKSKLMAEEICQEYRTKGVDCTIFRPRLIMGEGRLGILEKLFKLVKLGLPLPLIGRGDNHYQMVSVLDCVSATICALDKGCPNEVFNLGSENPPSEWTLLKNLLKNAGKKQPVIRTSGPLVKAALGALGRLGLEIMYKEQYMIADEEYILDISETKKILGWQPLYNDVDMIEGAYRSWKNLKSI